MKEVPFSEIKEGETFTYAAEQWTRIKDQKVSCCKVLNAAKTDNPAAKTQIGPSVQVQIND